MRARWASVSLGIAVASATVACPALDAIEQAGARLAASLGEPGRSEPPVEAPSGAAPAASATAGPRAAVKRPGAVNEPAASPPRTQAALEPTSPAEGSFGIARTDVETDGPAPSAVEAKPSIERDLPRDPLAARPSDGADTGEGGGGVESAAIDEAEGTDEAGEARALGEPDDPGEPRERARVGDAGVAPVAEPPSEAEPEPKKPAHVLASIAKETWVFAEPRWRSRRIGYLRAGAIVERRPRPAGWASCPEGWYRIQPSGYVCVGATATLDTEHPVVVASAKRPTLFDLPYTYVISRFPPPPLYARLPTPQQERRVEPDLASNRRKLARLAKDPEYVAPPPPAPIPSWLGQNRLAPALANARRSPDAVVLGAARTRSGFALLETFEHEQRRFGLTTELALIPIDRTRVVRPSRFRGLALDDTVTLPVAFVRSKHAFRYVPSGAALARGDKLGWREAVPLASGVRRVGGVRYLEAKDGTWLREDQVTRVDRYQHEPSWVAKGRKWIDVSILRQSLVAYEGSKPVYVTLVSTGADGLGDPKKTHSTIQGAFLVHTKHVTVTMDGDEKNDEFDFRDVPFVQYFTEGFALHGAYWHDDFGTPRSHGCVNLAPLDAAWLFAWTDPPVPEGWHAALSLKKGTLVYTHP